MPIIESCMGIRSERPLCGEVHSNLAYGYLYRLGLGGAAPVQRTFPKIGMADSGLVVFCESVRDDRAGVRRGRTCGKRRQRKKVEMLLENIKKY